MSDPTPCPTCGEPLAAGAACAKCAGAPAPQPAAGVDAPAAAAPEPPAPLSPLAVSAALAGAAGLFALLVACAIGGSVTPPAPRLLAWFAFELLPWVSFVALAAGSVLGVVAWRQIRKSAGRLRGERWAVTGTFLPLAAWCVYATAGNFDASQGPGIEPPAKAGRSYFVPESAKGERIAIDPAEERRIDELWSRVRRLPAAPTLADAEDLYSPSDRKVLKSLIPAGLAEGARGAHLGLPLLPRDVLKAPDLTLYSLTRVRFGAPIPSELVAPDCRAVATATDGKRTIRFVLERESAWSDWYFGMHDVEFE